MSDLLVLYLYQISDSICYVKNSNMLIKSENPLEIRLEQLNDFSEHLNKGK